MDRRHHEHLRDESRRVQRLLPDLYRIHALLHGRAKPSS